MAATVETGNNVVFWEDISHWVGTLTVDQMANELNNDHRHFNDCSVAQVFNVLFDVVGVIEKDLGKQPNPEDDSQQWRGLFDDYIRALANNQRGTLLKQAWNRLLTKGQTSEGNIPAGSNPNPPEVGSQDDRFEKAGYSLKEFDEINQELTDDPGYSGNLTGTQAERHQAVHAAWVAITGGRRFGIVTAADCQAVIDQHNADLQRQEAFAGTQDVRGKSQNAVNAADAEYRDNPDATRSSVNAAGDAAYNA